MSTTSPYTREFDTNFKTDVIVNFSTARRCPPPLQYNNLELYQGITSNPPLSSSNLSFPPSFSFSSVLGVSASDHSFRSPTITPSRTILNEGPSIPLSLLPQIQDVRLTEIQFFLNFHHEKITEAHYFCWGDYPKLYTKIIFLLAEHSEALRHAIVAFSALVYSFKVDKAAREVACLYYELALRGLRVLLDKFPMSLNECFIAVATALQLSSFDVYYPLNPI